MTLVTCMFGHHCDKCHMERISLEKYILGWGGQQFVESKIIIIIKGKKGKKIEKEQE